MDTNKAAGAREDEDKMNAAAHRTAVQLAQSLGQPLKRPATPAEARRLKGHVLANGITLDADEPMIKATVPKSFKMTLDNHSPLQVHQGIQELPLHIMEHWYAKAQGVKPFDPADLPKDPAAPKPVDVDALREQIRVEERARLKEEQDAEAKKVKDAADAAALATAQSGGKGKGEKK